MAQTNRLPMLKTSKGEHANCSNCYWRADARTCVMWRLTATWRCRHWKEETPKP